MTTMTTMTTMTPPEPPNSGGGAAAVPEDVGGKQQQQQQQQEELLECDYLVIGAGTSGMSFADTILTEDPTATLIIVDRNDKPGGHWAHAYPFVRLHQQSCNYGVNSLKLGKNRNKKGDERYDIDDRATGKEILEYYQKVREQFEATGRVRFYFDAEYDNFNKDEGVHVVSQNGAILPIKCRRKLVTVATNIVVPSMRKPSIPVHEAASASFVPINALPESIESGKFEKYVVFGCGKTGADAIVYLLRHGVEASEITWIVSRDVWYFIRDGMKDFFRVNKLVMGSILQSKSIKDAFLGMEKNGIIGRIEHPDGDVPEIFKGPAMNLEELHLMRSIENVVRLGRATAIEKDRIVLERGSINYDPSKTLLVDCMVNGFYGYHLPDNFTVFEPGRIHLSPVTFVFNASASAAHLAFLESALETDDAKNDCCYFVRGITAKTIGRLEQLIGAFHLTNHSVQKLLGVPGGQKFFMGSRTNLLAPMHHRGGPWRLLWFVHGPEGGRRNRKKLTKKVESGGFSDLDHSFGVETFATVEIAF